MFVVFIILLILMRQSKNDVRHSDIFRFFVFFFIICTCISVFLPSLSSIAFIAIIIYIIRKVRRIAVNKQNPQVDYVRSPYESAPKQTKSTILPRPVTKRLKIVKAFNSKYNLTLTPEQMQRIVDSSYMSEAWKREVEAMVPKYETIYEWFQGDMRYLRAYIHAFEIQEISSDITQQEQICIQAFHQIWLYADSLTNLTLEERIARVNAAYYTKFDNITFMIAYRFLEMHGYHHKLDAMDLVQGEADLERLKRKYQ